MKSAKALALGIALGPVDCLGQFACDGAASEWIPTLGICVAMAVAACRPTAESDNAMGDAIEPLAWIPAVALALWALMLRWWDVHENRAMVPLWPGAFAALALVAAGCLSTPAVFALRKLARSRRSTTRTLRPIAMTLTALAAALSLAASVARARRPSADAVFFATTIAPIQSDEHGEIRRLPGDRVIVRGPSDSNESEAARLYLRDLRTRSDTLLVPLRSRLAYGGSIRFEPRSEALVARFYLSGSTVVFLDEPATPHHSAWSARRRLAPSVPWIAMGWVSFALAIYATRRCRSRNAGSIGHSPYRAGQQTDGDDTIGRHERATTLWAVSSALLFLTPIVFALCAGMVAR